MVLVIDNYDSFTYNLVQLVKLNAEDVVVFRNNKITLDEIKKYNPSHILISPGPGRPENAGICIEIIKNFYKSIPILGVCLGHQAIGYAFGCKIIQAKVLMHGKTSLIYHNDESIYRNIENPFIAARYHSLIIDPESLVRELIVTSKTKSGTIMGIRHKNYPIEGIQFHPESILTKVGEKIIANWISKNK